MAARGLVPPARKTVPAAINLQGRRKTDPRKTVPDVPQEIVLEEIASPGNVSAFDCISRQNGPQFRVAGRTNFPVAKEMVPLGFMI